MLKAVPTEHSDQSHTVATDEWPILRACSCLGPRSATASILREVQREKILDHRTVLLLLRRLADKGYLEWEKETPRREVWSLVDSAEKMIYNEVGRVLRKIVGSDRRYLWMARKVVKDLEAELSE